MWAVKSGNASTEFACTHDRGALGDVVHRAAARTEQHRAGADRVDAGLVVVGPQFMSVWLL